MVIGFEPFRSQCTWAFKQPIRAPYCDTKSWEPWSFTEFPDCSQIQTSDIIWVQKGAHIKLTRAAPFPESSFICLWKFPEDEPPPGSWRGAYAHGQLSSLHYLTTFTNYSVYYNFAFHYMPLHCLSSTQVTTHNLMLAIPKCLTRL